MKLYDIINYIGYLSGIFGGLLILAGIIGFFTGSGFLGVRNFYNFFYVANSFLFLGIFILVGTRQFCHCNCHTHDEECNHDHSQK